MRIKRTKKNNKLNNITLHCSMLHYKSCKYQSALYHFVFQWYFTILTALIKYVVYKLISSFPDKFRIFNCVFIVPFTFSIRSWRCSQLARFVALICSMIANVPKHSFYQEPEQAVNSKIYKFQDIQSWMSSNMANLKLKTYTKLWLCDRRNRNMNAHK